MQDNNTQRIASELLKENSVVVVGKSDAGKTFWVHNSMIPTLKRSRKTIVYSDNPIETKEQKGDIYIFDEVETLFDRERLQKKYPEEKPYYSEKYLKEIKEWQTVYAQRTAPTLYIITRKENDIQFLVDNFTEADWDGRALKVFRFPFDTMS